MSDEKKIRAFFEALADNVESLSDEELLGEVWEEGQSPSDMAKRTRLLLQDTVQTFKERSVATKEGSPQQAKRADASSVQLPTSAAERRQLLNALIAKNQQAAQLLVARRRLFEELTDDDVESWLEQLGSLGLISPKSETD
jgi:hypothetical protein